MDCYCFWSIRCRTRLRTRQTAEQLGCWPGRFRSVLLLPARRVRRSSVAPGAKSSDYCCRRIHNPVVVVAAGQVAPSGAPAEQTTETSTSSELQATDFSPVATRSPALPAGPAAPATPCGPVSPLGPGGPWSPFGPAGPATPFSPGAPACPGGPCGPEQPQSTRLSSAIVNVAALISSSPLQCGCIIGWIKYMVKGE
jgi:hypothetical protein